MLQETYQKKAAAGKVPVPVMNPTHVRRIAPNMEVGQHQPHHTPHTRCCRDKSHTLALTLSMARPCASCQGPKGVPM